MKLLSILCDVKRIIQFFQHKIFINYFGSLTRDRGGVDISDSGGEASDDSGHPGARPHDPEVPSSVGWGL